MSIVTLTDVSKTYDADRILLENVTITVRPEDRIGLIGPNGAGKSTLMKLLAGLEVPDSGERVLQRGARIGYLEQEPHFPANETIRDMVRKGLAQREGVLAHVERLNDALASPTLTEAEMNKLLAQHATASERLEALGGHDVEHKVEAVIDGVGLRDPEALCGSLSGGEARRVALARLLLESPDVLLLDEPTNHLDAFVVAWLEERLAQLALPLVLVTHDRYLLDRVTNRIVEVDRGSLHMYEGGYLDYVAKRSARMNVEARGERSRQMLLRREGAWVKKSPLARTSKSKSRIQRFEEMVADVPKMLAKDLELAFPKGPRLGARVVNLSGVSHTYDVRPILPKLDFELENGMRLGVVGPNGAGKSTFIRILLGEQTPTTGTVERGETVKFGVMQQGREELDPDATVCEEVAGKGDHVMVGGRRVHVASFLDNFLFPGAKKEVEVNSLSGGERGRLLVAKLMLTGANVLILDEPTNDLDLPTLRALEEALVAFEGTSVVVSHDRWFLDRVATHVLYLDGEGNMELHTGDVSSLLEKVAVRKAEEASRAKGKAKPASKALKPVEFKELSSKKAGPKPKVLAPWEERELEELTAKIEQLEGRIGEFDTVLADPDTYAGDGAKAREIETKRSKVKAELDPVLSRWEELAERVS